MAVAEKAEAEKAIAVAEEVEKAVPMEYPVVLKVAMQAVQAEENIRHSYCIV